MLGQTEERPPDRCIYAQYAGSAVPEVAENKQKSVSLLRAIRYDTIRYEMLMIEVFLCFDTAFNWTRKTPENRILIKGKGSRYSITKRRVPELIPVLGSQPVGDVNHKPDG